MDDFEVEHCGADNGTILRDYIADSMARRFEKWRAGKIRAEPTVNGATGSSNTFSSKASDVRRRR